VRRYDFDTRRAIAQALREGSKHLAQMCAQAERGERVGESFVGESFVGETEVDYRTLAHELVKMLETGGLPDFLLHATTSAINATAWNFNIDVWLEFPDSLAPGEDYDGQGYSVLALTDLFRVARIFQLPEPTLAEHISAVLNHPEAPTRIYDALAGAVTGITAKDKVANSPEVIRLALKLHCCLRLSH